MTSIEKLQQVIENGENIAELCAILAVELESRSAKLVDLVQALGPWLTDVDKERRVKGTKILSEIIKLLPKDFLSEEECNLMSAFYCNRLNDHYTVIPATLSGIEALCLMDNLPDHSPSDFLMGLQTNVICQSLTVSHRNSFYTIFHNLFINKRSKILSSIASDFLYGLVSGMASEHDPRNLLYLFSFLPSVLSEIPLKHLKEEAFSVLESYFPVDYSPINENDPITRDDLARNLEKCLASKPEFADLCFPMICEKLDSSLVTAQMDALMLLISGMKVWGVDALSMHIEEVWSALRGVLVPSAEAQVSLLASEAVVAILTAYSTAVLGSNETKAFSYLLESISSSTHSFLSDPGLSLFVPTLRLLSAVASVSSATADFVIPRVLPQLVALLESNSSCTNKETVLKSLHPLLQISITFNSWNNDSCKSHLEKVPPVLMKLLLNPLTCGASLLCLSAIHSKTDEGMRQTVFELVKNIAPSDCSKYTRDECAKFIRRMSEEYPKEVQNTIVSTFSIPDHFDSEKSKRFLELLLWIMEAETLTVSTAKLFLKFISEEDDGHSIRRADSVFILRDYLLNRESEKFLSTLGGKECDFPLTLLRSYVHRTRTSEDEIAAAATLLSCLVRSLSTQEQEYITHNGLLLLKERVNSTKATLTDLVLLEGLLCGLQSSVEISDSLSLCENLLRYSLTSQTELARTSAARLVAVMINKSQIDNEVSSLVEIANYLIRSESENRAATVKLCAWITKALVLRGHPLAGSWLEQLISFTSDESIGMEAADGVRLVLEESSVLSSENFCTVGLLYKQRVFEKIELLIPANGKLSKPASLALAFILKNCPTVLIIARLEKLIRVMVHCLDDGDEIVSSAILEILSALLKVTVPELARFAEDLIPRCLNLANTSPCMAVRIGALDCIYQYAGYKTEDILPYKMTVVSRLQKCLDDKKRLVRQSAVRARTKWFVV